MNLSQKMSIDGYQLRVWGIEDGFNQTGMGTGSGYGYFKFPDGTETDSVRAIAAKLSLEDFLALKAKKEAEEAAILKDKEERELPSSTLPPRFLAISRGGVHMNQALSRAFPDFCVV